MKWHQTTMQDFQSAEKLNKLEGQNYKIVSIKPEVDGYGKISHRVSVIFRNKTLIERLLKL